MKKYRIGVIGLGMGRSHLNGYKEHPQAELAAIADTDPERLAKVKAEFGIPAAYADAHEMLKKENLDIVSVVLPNKFHKEYTLAALAKGAHVLCEKPVAMNAKEAEDMIAAAKKADRRLMINFSYRFNPQSFAMKKLVESGELGHIYFARSIWLRRRGMPGFGGWFGQKALAGGGPLIDLGVHRLDLALWLMGYPEPEWVMGTACSPIAAPLAAAQGKAFDVEDFAAAMIKFKNGTMLELEASWAANIKENELMETRLLGTQAGLHHYNLNGTYEFDAEMYLEKAGCQFDMKLHAPVPKCKNAQYSFVDAIVGDLPTPAPAEEGLLVMKLLDAIYLSAAKGEPIKIQ